MANMRVDQNQQGYGRVELAGLLVLVLAAVLRVWGLDAGLPHLMTRPDEEVIVLQTGQPANGVFFLSWIGQHPGIPSAYIYLLWIWGEVGLRILQLFDAAPAGDYVAILRQFPDRILLTERFFSVCAGVGTVFALMWIARREMGDRVALLAGLILATSVFHVRDSHSAKPDIALGLFMILALGLLAPLTRNLTRRGVCWAGLAIGLAMAMKPPGILLLFPGWLACIWGSSQTGWRRVFPAEIFWLTGIAGAVFLGTSPDFVFNSETASQLMAIPGFVLPMLSGTEPLGIEQNADSGVQMWPGLRYHLEFSFRYGLGLLFVLLLPAALAWGFLSRQALAVLGGTFFVVAYLVFGTSPVLLSRYMTPLLPVAALLLAAFLVQLGDWAGLWRSRPKRLLVVGILGVLVWEPLSVAVQFDRLMSVEDTRVSAHQWMIENTEKEDRIALQGAVFWSWGDPQIPRGRKIVPFPLGSAANKEPLADYLVVHDHPLFASTADWELLESIRSQYLLVAEFDPFIDGAQRALYESDDAFYVPTREFSAVNAPGPRILIFALVDPAIPSTGGAQ